MWTTALFFYALDTRGEHHHTQSGSDGLGRQVVAEVGTDSTRISVGASDLAPHNSVLSTSTLGRTVDESNTFAEVVMSGINILHAFQLQKRDVGVLVPLAPLETKMNGLGVKSGKKHTLTNFKKRNKQTNNTSRAVPSWR